MKARLKVDQKSIDGLYNALLGLQTGVAVEMVAEMKELAHNIRSMSDDIIPVDTGTAQSTSYADDPDVKDYEVSVEIGYARADVDRVNPETGKMASDYVYELHEDLGMPHTSGAAKFLETALVAHIKQFMEASSRALSRAITTTRGR